MGPHGPELHDLFDGGHRHVVEHDPAGSGVEGLDGQGDSPHFYTAFHGLPGARHPRPTHRSRRHPYRQCDVVLLEQDQRRQVEAVVVAAPGGDRVLVQGASARRRLARVQNVPRSLPQLGRSGRSSSQCRTCADEPRGPVFVTHRRPGPGRVVSPRDVCPDTGLARLSYGQARALLDKHTAVDCRLRRPYFGCRPRVAGANAGGACPSAPDGK